MAGAQAQIALGTEVDAARLLLEVQWSLLVEVPAPRNNLKTHVEVVFQNGLFNQTQIIDFDFIQVQSSQLAWVEDQWVLGRAPKTREIFPHPYIGINILDAEPKLVEYLSQTQLVEEALLFLQDLIKDIVNLCIRGKAQLSYTILVPFLYERLQVLLQLRQRFHERFPLVVHEEHFVR